MFELTVNESNIIKYLNTGNSSVKAGLIQTHSLILAFHYKSSIILLCVRSPCYLSSPALLYNQLPRCRLVDKLHLAVFAGRADV